VQVIVPLIGGLMICKKCKEELNNLKKCDSCDYLAINLRVLANGNHGKIVDRYKESDTYLVWFDDLSTRVFKRNELVFDKERYDAAIKIIQDKWWVKK
jgi:hypothetical protein